MGEHVTATLQQVRILTMRRYEGSFGCGKYVLRECMMTASEISLVTKAGAIVSDGLRLVLPGPVKRSGALRVGRDHTNLRVLNRRILSCLKRRRQLASRTRRCATARDRGERGEDISLVGLAMWFETGVQTSLGPNTSLFFSFLAGRDERACPKLRHGYAEIGDAERERGVSRSASSTAMTALAGGRRGLACIGCCRGTGRDKCAALYEWRQTRMICEGRGTEACRAMREEGWRRVVVQRGNDEAAARSAATRNGDARRGCGCERDAGGGEDGRDGEVPEEDHRASHGGLPTSVLLLFIPRVSSAGGPAREYGPWRGDTDELYIRAHTWPRERRWRCDCCTRATRALDRAGRAASLGTSREPGSSSTGLILHIPLLPLSSSPRRLCCSLCAVFPPPYTFSSPCSVRRPLGDDGVGAVTVAVDREHRAQQERGPRVVVLRSGTKADRRWCTSVDGVPDVGVQCSMILLVMSLKGGWTHTDRRSRRPNPSVCGGVGLANVFFFSPTAWLLEQVTSSVGARAGGSADDSGASSRFCFEGLEDERIYAVHLGTHFGAVRVTRAIGWGAGLLTPPPNRELCCGLQAQGGIRRNLRASLRSRS
ncbi:hypothetical protein B0H19DRAFT_1074417 [Mycena capillaripes]|nr:hypothetical protein B0H19DRAFT_1074417 [Mycena capillaripes]